MAAWNTGDGAAFALLFAGEAVYRAADGGMHRGRVAIARLVQAAGAHVELAGEVEVREHEAGVAIGFDWAMTSAKRAGRITCVLSPHGDTWRIERLDNEPLPGQNT